MFPPPDFLLKSIVALEQVVEAPALLRGTFVFELGGQRWASDTGSDSYQLPEYFTQTVQHRYGFYRKSTAGHNTLTFDNDNNDNSNRGACDQYPGMAGITEIILFQHGTSAITTSPAYAIVDLTAAYANQTGASRVQRGFAFTEHFEQLIIVDEIEFSNRSSAESARVPSNVTWTMHTFAQITTTGTRALLSLGGAALHAKILEPVGSVSVCTFHSAKVSLAPPQRSSTGLSKLMIHLPMPTPQVENIGSMRTAASTRIVVSLSLNASAVPSRTRTLAQWEALGPFVERTP